MKEILSVLQQAKRIVVVSHQRPDGDTGGAALALTHWLDNATAFCVDKFPDSLRFLPGALDVSNNPETLKSADVIIICDAGDIAHANIEQFLDTGKKPVIINIDHHASNTQFGDYNLVDTQASSTTQVVYNLMKEGGVEMTKDIALCLLTGLFTDTGGFSNGATTAESLEIASELMQHGASIPAIYRETIGNKSLEVMKLWGTILKRLETSPERIAYTYVTLQDLNDCNLDHQAMEGLANYLSQIKNAEAVFVFTELEPQNIKVSMRTIHEHIDVSKLATKYGGGGHKKAAGFSFTADINNAFNHLAEDLKLILP